MTALPTLRKERARQAEQDYINILARVPDAYHRTSDQQTEVDAVLSVKMRTYYAVLHAGMK